MNVIAMHGLYNIATCQLFNILGSEKSSYLILYAI